MSNYVLNNYKRKTNKNILQIFDILDIYTLSKDDTDLSQNRVAYEYYKSDASSNVGESFAWQIPSEIFSHCTIIGFGIFPNSNVKKECHFADVGEKKH